MFYQISGYLLTILVGISLGLIGSGGSILTVPILVYVLGIDPVKATSYDLFIVGISSMFGMFAYIKQKLVSLPHVLAFGIPSIISIFLTRHYVLPAIPDRIPVSDSLTFSKSFLIMLLFGVLMLLASYSMIKGRKDLSGIKQKVSPAGLGILGFSVGILTGMVGIGGGFLIIPALTLYGKLPMKKAVGTSLSIIVLKSLMGFAGSLTHFNPDWKFLTGITCFSILGIFIGVAISRKVDGQKLKPVFGWFILIMAIFILLKEILLQKP